MREITDIFGVLVRITDLDLNLVFPGARNVFGVAFSDQMYGLGFAPGSPSGVKPRIHLIELVLQSMLIFFVGDLIPFALENDLKFFA